MTERVPLVIDTDAGTDDCVALWWALTDPRVDILGLVVTWGNVELPVAVDNCRRVLAAAGRSDIPVVVGEKESIGPTPLPTLAHFVHGEDGLGGHAAAWPTGDVDALGEPPVDWLGRIAASRPGEVVLATIGPLSTVGAALREDPSIAGGFAELVVMGGAVARAGNALPLAEANIAHDPEAASEVVAAAWTSPPLLVGLDVTLQALLSEHHLALAALGRTPAARMLAGPLAAYAGFYAGGGEAPPGHFPCHDLLGLLAAVEPEIVGTPPVVPLAVDTGGSAAWGTTVADLRPRAESTAVAGSAWRVGLDVDAERFASVAEGLFT